MTKALLSLLAVLAMTWPALAAVTQTTAQSKTTTQSKTSKRRSHSKSTAQPASAAKAKTTSVKGKSKSKSTVAHKTVRSYQQVPTPERYQEIQKALASKGYFQGQANGQWGPDSADALKRFQSDQNLMPDGKINSLSLIAMGLGPKRLTAQSKPATPPNPATPSNPPTPAAAPQ